MSELTANEPEYLLEMAMDAIASLELKVRAQDEAIANLKAELGRPKLLVDEIALPKSEFFVWYSTPRGRQYELIECRGLGAANAYGQNKYGIDFIAITEATANV